MFPLLGSGGGLFARDLPVNVTCVTEPCSGLV